MDEKELELFREDGCLTDEGLQALRDGQLDELGRLEAAEHLSYCDKCMDRYTALLTADVLETPPRGVHGTIMTTIWVRLMTGKPMETRQEFYHKLSGVLENLLPGKTPDAGAIPTTPKQSVT